MKKKTSLLAVFITVFSLCSHAQLKVTNNGLVAIACNNSSNSFSSYLSVGNSTSDYAASVKGSQLYSSGIYADAGMSTGNSWMIGIKGRSDRADVGLYKVGVWGDAVQGYINTIGRSYGVYGIAGNATSGWNFGVCGILDGGNYGTGIYGSASPYNIYAVDGIYAGYFNGPTKVAGNLKVTGSINGILLGASVNSSNGELIEEGSFANRLQSLQAISYYYDTNTNEVSANAGDTTCIVPESSAVEKQVLERVHYGLKADQLKETFPELVYEQEDGSLGINYVELVPVLVQTINELNTRVNMLEGDGARKSRTTNIRNIQEEQTFLLQNRPNPTSGTTTISYCVPENSNSAELCICELSGKMLKNINLSSGTKSSVTVSTDDLASGIYLYTLIVDGEVCASKRMIVKH